MRCMQAIVKLSEDHLACRGLQNAGDRNVDGVRNHFFGVVHYHHGAVVEVGHALVEFLALFENEHSHDLARQYDRLHCVGQLVDVQDHYAVQLRDLVQVEIVRHDLTVVDLGQLDQLHIHFADVGKVVLHDLDIEMDHFLDALQD